jgi:hypothetical protein
MRYLYAVVAIAPLLAARLLTACGTDTAPIGSAADASTPTTPTGDAGGGTGGGTDGGGSGDGSTSADGSTAADAGTGACTSPAGCSGATPVCCGTIVVTGGTVPNCTTDPPKVACTSAASCATQLGTTCSGTQTVRLCAMPADCTEATANKCCTFKRDGGSLSFCASALVAGIAGGTCM